MLLIVSHVCVCIRRLDGALSKASHKLGITYFDFEAVRQQILKEGLEVTRTFLRANEEAGDGGATRLWKARAGSFASEVSNVKCERCTETKRTTTLRCTDCIVRREGAWAEAKAKAQRGL